MMLELVKGTWLFLFKYNWFFSCHSKGCELVLRIKSVNRLKVGYWHWTFIMSNTYWKRMDKLAGQEVWPAFST
jgi:hypothetical protein